MFCDAELLLFTFEPRRDFLFALLLFLDLDMIAVLLIIWSTIVDYIAVHPFCQPSNPFFRVWSTIVGWSSVEHAAGLFKCWKIWTSQRHVLRRSYPVVLLTYCELSCQCTSHRLSGFSPGTVWGALSSTWSHRASLSNCYWDRRFDAGPIHR